VVVADIARLTNVRITVAAAAGVGGVHIIRRLNFAFVCLSFCLSAGELKKLWTNFREIFGEVGCNNR